MNRKILLPTAILSATALGLSAYILHAESVTSKTTEVHDTPTELSESTQHSVYPHTPLSHGLSVTIDPETGKMRTPTTEELEELQIQEQQIFPTAGSPTLVEEALPDGSVMVDLQGLFQHQITAKVVDLTTSKNADTSNTNEEK